MQTGLRYYSIARGNLRVGVAETSLTNAATSRHHVLAFDNVTMARHVQYRMHPTPTLSLSRNVSLDIDVTKEILKNLETEGVRHLHQDWFREDTKIVMNLACTVSVPKMDPNNEGGPLHPHNDGGFHLDTLHPVQVFMLPFERNVGILIPRDISSESGEHIILECNLIDPCEDTRRWVPPVV